jgi:hypothetical protein
VEDKRFANSLLAVQIPVKITKNVFVLLELYRKYIFDFKSQAAVNVILETPYHIMSVL